MSNLATTAKEVLCKLDHKLGGIINGSWITESEYDFIATAAGIITSLAEIVIAGPAPLVEAKATMQFYPPVGVTYTLTTTPTASATYDIVEGVKSGEVVAGLATQIQAQLGDGYIVETNGGSLITEKVITIESRDGTDITITAFTVA